MSEPALAISFDLTPADYWALTAQACNTKRLPNPTWVKLGLVALWFATVAVFFVFFRERPSRLEMILLFIAVMIPIAVQLLKTLGARSRLAPRPDGAVLGKHDLVIREDGIEYNSANIRSFFGWSAFIERIETPAHVILMIDTAAGVLIPKRALPSPDQLQAVLPERLRRP